MLWSRGLYPLIRPFFPLALLPLVYAGIFSCTDTVFRHCRHPCSTLPVFVRSKLRHIVA